MTSQHLLFSNRITSIILLSIGFIMIASTAIFFWKTPVEIILLLFSVVMFLTSLFMVMKHDNEVQEIVDDTTKDL